MTTWYDYMVRASKHAGSDGDLWFRYLYKVIQDEETKLTAEDIEQLLKNPSFIIPRNNKKTATFRPQSLTNLPQSPLRILHLSAHLLKL